MNFSILFLGNDDSQSCKGSILLGEHAETFQSCLKDFSRDQYEQQWLNALRIVLRDRRPTALFQSVDIVDDGVGTLWLYPIIPSEFAGDTAEKRLRLSDFPRRDDAGVYLGERFMPVTVKASNFERRFYEEFEDGSKGDELAFYYLDLTAPERFFGYLGDDIADVSHWYFPNSDLEAFLSSK